MKLYVEFSKFLFFTFDSRYYILLMNLILNTEDYFYEIDIHIVY